MFWTLVGGMLLAAIAAVVAPLLRKPAGEKWADVPADLYRQRIDELRADVAEGALAPADESAAREDIQRALLTDAERAADEIRPPTAHDRLTGIVLVLLSVPTLALAVYLGVGSPHLALSPPPPAAASTAGLAEHHGTFEEMVTQLEARLQSEPDNAQGWVLLARTYQTLQNYPKAVAAMERAYQITGDQPAVLLQYANLLGMENGGTLTGRPAEMVKRALAIEPDNLTALWLAGFVEQEIGNDTAALEHWRRAQKLAAAGSEIANNLGTMIAQAEARAGIVPAAGATPSAATAGPHLRVAVRLARHLQSQVSADDTVFVFARSLDGQPPPLAVARRRAGELPFELVVNDSMAMTPQRAISSVDAVRLVARVSKSGNAIVQGGDLEGEVTPVPVNTTDTIEITISNVVQKPAPN